MDKGVGCQVMIGAGSDSDIKSEHYAMIALGWLLAAGLAIRGGRKKQFGDNIHLRDLTLRPWKRN